MARPSLHMSKCLIVGNLIKYEPYDMTKPGQNECMPSKGLDQPWNPPSLIIVLAVCSVGNFGSSVAFFMWTAKTELMPGVG